MSSFSKLTKHPKTGVWHVADWLDDFFGQHNYGVRFPNGEVFDPRKTNLETKDGGLFKATEPAEFVKECRKEAEQSMKEVKEQLEPKPQEGKLPYWCKHIHWQYGPHPWALFDNYRGDNSTINIVDSWTVCMICAAPRPSKPTKREELIKRLQHAWESEQCIHYDTMKLMLPILADSALSFLGGKGE